MIFKVGGGIARMLRYGEVDIIDHDPYKETWEYNPGPNITFDYVNALSIIQFDLNNQMFPTNNTDFRRALAHLADKQAYNSMYKKADVIHTPVPQVLGEFINPNVPTYAYSLTEAEEILDNSGFRDWDDDGWRDYSPDQGATVIPVTLKMYSPLQVMPDVVTYKRQRYYMVWTEWLLHGIFYDFWEKCLNVGLRVEMPDVVPASVVRVQVGSVVTFNLKEVIEDHDYNVCLDKLTPFEPGIDYLYNLYHSSFADYVINPRLEGANWVCFNNTSYDITSSNLMRAQSSSMAQYWARECQTILANEVAVIPLLAEEVQTFRRINYGDWPGDELYKDMSWVHAVNQKGRGFDSYWTFLNMHPAGYERGGTIRYGVEFDAGYLDPRFSDSKTDLTIFDLIYEPLLRRNPYNPFEFVPWLANDYKVGTWEKPGVGTCTAVNVTLIPSILWQDATTANPWTLTAEDVGFSYGYLRDFGTTRYYAVKDFDSYVIHDRVWSDQFMKYLEVVELRFSVLQSWMIENYMADVPIIPKHIWEGVSGLWDPADHDAFIGTGPYMFYKDGVVGRVNRVVGNFIYLQRSPAYFRRLVRPEFYPYNETTGEVGDGRVRIGELTTVCAQAGYGYPDWLSDRYGPLADVNKDLVVDSEDVMEVSVRMGMTGCTDGYPLHYVYDPPPSGTQSTAQPNQACGSNSELFLSQTENSPMQSLVTQVSVSPPIITAGMNKTFTLEINVSNVIDLYGWTFRVSFDPDVLNAINAIEGSFLKTAGGTRWMTPVINNTLGTITANCVLSPLPSQGATGSGTIATITFHVQNDGETILHMDKTKLNTVISGNVMRINHEATDGYLATTIQAAVDSANATDTIYVTAGTYYESVTVNKSLAILGENRDITIIDGNKADRVIYVKANYVTIKGFTVRDGNKTGIWVEGDECTIANNVISETTGVSNSSGLLLTPDSSYNQIQNNTIQNNLWGLWIASQSHHNTISTNVISSNSYGIRIDPDASNNTLYYNNIAYNTNYGIGMTECRSENHICHNYISNNERGIDFYRTSNQKIRSNEISNNQFGIKLSRSDNNVIYRNNFIDNSFQTKSTKSINIWDNGFASEGNYWSDYAGEDLDGDGIGDTPYVIDRNNKDNYPLMNLRSPLIGDVDGDWDVDDDDWNRVYENLGAWYPVWDPYWGPRCDIAGTYPEGIQPIPDGVVDTDDLMTVDAHKGDTWPP